jgi:membrane-associated protein
MTLLGYFLGGFEIVKQHTEALVLLVIFVSILPGFIEWWRVKRAQKRADAQAAQPPAST